MHEVPVWASAGTRRNRPAREPGVSVAGGGRWPNRAGVGELPGIVSPRANASSREYPAGDLEAAMRTRIRLCILFGVLLAAGRLAPPAVADDSWTPHLENKNGEAKDLGDPKALKDGD